MVHNPMNGFGKSHQAAAKPAPPVQPSIGGFIDPRSEWATMGFIAFLRAMHTADQTYLMRAAETLAGVLQKFLDARSSLPIAWAEELVWQVDTLQQALDERAREINRMALRGAL